MARRDPLFREHNPLASLLRSSDCVFRLALAAGAGVDRALIEECARIGASLVCDTSESGERMLTLSASHALLDAFGGLFMLSHFGPGVLEQARAVPVRSLARAGRVGAFSYHHFMRERAGAGGCDAGRGTELSPTPTQRFLRRLLRLPAFGATRVALAVAKDDTRALIRDNYLGNSLVLLELDASELSELASAPRPRWRAAIAERSDRVMAIALRRPSVLQLSKVAFMLSSVGDIERLDWAGRLEPSCFEMVPTPPAGSATVVWWGNGRRQALTLCAGDGHPLMDVRDDVRQAWEGSLDAACA